jgi:HSP20 family protein
MDIIKIRFSSDLGQSGSEFEQNIKEMFQSLSPMFTFSERSWKPMMDIYETPDELFILAEIAGVDKETLELEVNTKAIKIHGTRIAEPPAGNARYCLAEIQHGSFERVLFLPAPIDTERVSATYTDGLLKVRMSKQKKTTQSIPIQDG